MNLSESALNTAKDLLAAKNSGPCGVLAYTLANADENITFYGQSGSQHSFCRPYLYGTSNLTPYFTVVRHNRTGIEVVAPPGGTQDVLFSLDGKKMSMELAKPKNQIEFLKGSLGIEFEKVTDESFVAALLSDKRVLDVRLEDEFAAAVRETSEEHGWVYDSLKAIKRFDVDAEILSKRSFETDPPTPVKQKIFVIGVTDFKDVTPARTDKIETKIKTDMGREFFEQGDFMSLAVMENMYESAIRRLRNPDGLSGMAETELKVTRNRLDVISRINQTIMNNLS